MPSNFLILGWPLLLLRSIFTSIRVFSKELALHIRWPKYWSFSFSISPSNEYSGLISFRIYWFDLLDVQGTLKSLLQHHSWKASILWHSAFFMVQLSYPYMITGKTIALTRWTFISKVMSLIFFLLFSNTHCSIQTSLAEVTSDHSVHAVSILLSQRQVCPWKSFTKEAWWCPQWMQGL